MDVKADTTKIFLTTTNLHFVQYEFCSHHWVHLFSITGEFTFRKECISKCIIHAVTQNYSKGASCLFFVFPFMTYATSEEGKPKDKGTSKNIYN